jgi:hypothetical protein
MRPSLPSPACALLMVCLFAAGCSAGSPFTGTGPDNSKPPVITPVTTPVTVGSGPTVQDTSVSVMISDPAACKAPNGPLSHVYITITDVRASTNADAPANDPSFVDLTPKLSAAPQQVDLLGQANSRCFLASLSVGQQVAAGNYQQLRIFLAPDSAASTVQNNACGASYSNCLVKTDNSLHDLQLAAATANGIEIPTSEISNASVSLEAGAQPSLDVDFDTCSSILLTSDGGYEFNPAIHVGLIPSSGGSISGTVVSSATGQALHGGSVVVALEQKDAKTGIDRILMRTAANSTGNFILCPVPQGTYDLVAVGVDGANISYSAGVETGIQSGQLTGQIPLVPGSGEGTLQGLITTQNGGRPSAGVAVAVETDALQQLANNGATITVPLLPTYNPYNASMLTANAAPCPQGVDCATFSMQLPAAAPNVVACSEQTARFTQQGSSTPDYTAEAFAQIPGTGSIADCVSNSVTVAATPQGRSIVLNPDQSTTAATLAFTQCE